MGASYYSNIVTYTIIHLIIAIFDALMKMWPLLSKLKSYSILYMNEYNLKIA